MSKDNKKLEKKSSLSQQELIEWANFLYGRYRKRKELQNKQQKKTIIESNQ